MIIKVHNRKTSKSIPAGARFLTALEMTELNARLRKVMQVKVRENQKKQQVSLQKAAKLILNA